MSSDLVPLRDIVRVVYGSALREPERVQSGDFDVFGSAGPVGRHDQALTTEPTIVIGRKGSVGAITYAPSGGWVIDTAFYVELIDRENVDLRYLFHALAAAKLARHTITTSIPGLSRDDIYRTHIRVPSRSEQRRIADILDKADAIRRKRKEAIALTEELLRSAFLEMFGDPATNPKGWPEGALEDLCSDIVDCPHTTPTYAGTPRPYPCVRSSDLQDGFLELSTTKHVSELEYQGRIARLRPKAGDVLYSREGARFGMTALIPACVDLCLGQRMMLMRANEAVAAPEFLWGTLNSPAGYRQAAASVGGSASPHVNVKDIRRFRVLRPPPSLQRSFADFYHRSIKVRSAQLASVLESKRLSDALVQRAFRGEPSTAPSKRQLGMFEVAG